MRRYFGKHHLNLRNFNPSWHDIQHFLNNRITIKANPLIMKKIPVAVVLGSPAASCARYGICSIEDDVAPSESTCAQAEDHRHVKGILSYNVEQNRLILSFHQEHLSPLTKRMFFSPSGFLIEQEKALPNGLCEAIGVPLGTKFSPGLWPVEEAPHEVAIYVRPATSCITTLAI